MEKEQQKELSNVLGLSRGIGNTNIASWAEIYVEIGRLKQRAEFSYPAETTTTGDISQRLIQCDTEPDYKDAM